MIHRLLTIKDARPTSESGKYNDGQRANLSRFTKSGLRKLIDRKRARVNLVYAFLLLSILFTTMSASITYVKLNENGETNSAINSAWVVALLLLAATSTLALVTIIRKDRSNGKLLSKLRLTNRTLEAQVKMRTRELAEAIQAKDHFLGRATHDLKAPISSILGLLELVRLQNNVRSSEEIEYLEHIEYSCRKMQRLINDILEINRLDQGKYRPKRQSVDLSLLVDRLKMDFLPQARNKNIRMNFVLDIEGTIDTDADSLSRILDNLLSNAIKFSPEMKMVTLQVSAEASGVKFAVSDEGPGIPFEEQPKLFQKFQTLSNNVNNSETSTGLGLSIVKELTANLGGHISFITEVGKGSIFIVTLPYPGHQLQN